MDARPSQQDAVAPPAYLNPEAKRRWEIAPVEGAITMIFADLRARSGYTYVERSRRQGQSNPRLMIAVTSYRTGDGLIFVACRPRQAWDDHGGGVFYYTFVRDDEEVRLLLARQLDVEIGKTESQHAEVIGTTLLNIEDPLTTMRSMKATEELFDGLSLSDFHLDSLAPPSE